MYCTLYRCTGAAAHLHGCLLDAADPLARPPYFLIYTTGARQLLRPARRDVDARAAPALPGATSRAGTREMNNTPLGAAPLWPTVAQMLQVQDQVFNSID